VLPYQASKPLFLKHLVCQVLLDLVVGAAVNQAGKVSAMVGIKIDWREIADKLSK
jgi:hypothetical protein